MKKILPAVLIILLVWGCSKKLTPANSETASSNSGAVKTQTTATETATITGQIPAGTTGNTETKIATETVTDMAVAGQSVYNAKCGRCHDLKAAAAYTAERWVNILAVMAPRARLTEAEKENVSAYVKANSKK